MSEDEIEAWSGVTEEAAMHIVNMVSAAAGETLLRGALRKLAGLESFDEKHRTALIYQALMAATDAGYECGIVQARRSDMEHDLYAVIELPDGRAAFPLSALWVVVYPEHVTETQDEVRKFLNAGESADDGKAQSTTEVE